MKVAVTSRSFSKNEVLRAELISQFPTVRFNDDGLSLAGDQLITFLEGYDAAIVALERIDESILRLLPNLKVISKYGVGIDMIDLSAMRKYGKKLGWTKGVNKRAVSELAIAQILSVLRRTHLANQAVLKGEFSQIQGRQLSGLTVGIIGCGNVGQDLISLLKAFSCKILVNDIEDRKDFCKSFNAEQTSLQELLQSSDVVSLHVPLNESTRNLIGPREVETMKKRSILINLSRGGIVCEVALKTALLSGHLYGAAFDVFDPEPPVDMELLRLPSFIATPHIGGSSEEAVLAMGRSAIQGLLNNSVPELNLC